MGTLGFEPAALFPNKQLTNISKTQSTEYEIKCYKKNNINTPKPL